MWERRAAIMLCVLLSHAFLLYSLMRLVGAPEPREVIEEFRSELAILFIEPLESAATPETAAEIPATAAPAPASTPATPAPAAASPAPGAGESAAITQQERVDWPIEAKKSAARVLAAEAEAERIAKMFAGPGGTWASLTKRQRSKINKFRFKRGVDGLEKDSDGNIIYRLSDGCVVVNSAFIGCAIGKARIHDDMFENMRLYFDEQRLPRTDEGNGTEPESLREP
jgi:hypothetical protein